MSSTAPLPPRVALIDRENVAEEDRPILDHVASSRGGRGLANVFKALANNPSALEQVAGVGEYLRFKGDLDPDLRELVILTVAQETRCVYEWTHHWRIAERQGVASKFLEAVGSERIESELPPLGPALKYARLVATLQPVEDSTVAQIRESIGAKGLIELTVLVGYYGLIARVINTLNVPLEDRVSAQPFLR